MAVAPGFAYESGRRREASRLRVKPPHKRVRILRPHPARDGEPFGRPGQCRAPNPRGGGRSRCATLCRTIYLLFPINYWVECSEFDVMLARSRESRKSVRRWMRRGAHVIFDACEQPIRCEIYDLSNGGARLGFAAPIADLPRTFTLVLFKDSVQRGCEMVWTDGRIIGIKFISEWSVTKSAERARPQKST
jgi:hypothetical protein